MNLEIAPNAIIAIPTGFSTSHWAQLDGCGKLEPLPPSINAQRASAPGLRSSRSSKRPPICARSWCVATPPPVISIYDLRPAPAGQVAACVPFADHAEARFVPTPDKACAS